MENKNKYRELEERMTKFAKRIVELCKELPKNNINNELTKQVIRSSGSIGANYMEANEALSKKDFKYRLRVSRKEAKETTHWLEVIESGNSEKSDRLLPLLKESRELRNILTAILSRAESF